MTQIPLFSDDNPEANKVADRIRPIHQRYMPTIKKIEEVDNCEINIWDIPNTIKELSYLTHSHYRYYGKFPSVVAGQIIDNVSMPKDGYIFDNFNGSGTSLVEAKLRGIRSVGLDVSWLSVLASNVKTRSVNIRRILTSLEELVSRFHTLQSEIIFEHNAYLSKWFTFENARDLTVIRNWLILENQSYEKDFLLIGFLGIIRRTSKAYDAEVRPHINPDKKVRDVISAYSKKIRDMCKHHSDFLHVTSGDCIAEAYLGNNIKLPSFLDDGKCHLAISHPPYLNSFNYTPVYSLEFYWAEPFEAHYADNSIGLAKKELKAHPATDKITQDYFDHLETCYKETARIQNPGAYLAIVIGDCTRNGKLISATSIVANRVKKIGYKQVEMNYRTTHYGLGKYAYDFRADYHGEGVEKRDAIMIFEREA